MSNAPKQPNGPNVPNVKEEKVVISMITDPNGRAGFNITHPKDILRALGMIDFAKQRLLDQMTGKQPAKDAPNIIPATFLPPKGN